MSETRKGRKLSQETINKILKTKKEKNLNKHSEETKEKIRQTLLNKNNAHN